MKAPRCRCCGKPIAKKTVTHVFGSKARGGGEIWIEHEEPANTRAEAQRHLNGTIISSRPSYNGGLMVRVWDGVSYAPWYGHFCTVRCAADFGQLAAEHTDLKTVRYVETLSALG